MQLQTVFLDNETWQMDKKMSLDMMIFHWDLGCGIQTWHLSVLGI